MIIGADMISPASPRLRDMIERFAWMPSTNTAVIPRNSRARACRERHEEAIQALITHADECVAKIDLDRSVHTLSDEDFQPVVAPLELRDVLG